MTIIFIWAAAALALFALGWAASFAGRNIR